MIKVSNDKGMAQNIINENDTLTKERTTNWEKANVVNQKARSSQDNGMLYQFLFDSVSESVNKRLMLNSGDCDINDTKIASLYHESIIGKVEVETRASLALIRNNLMNLKTRMEDLNYSVNNFHNYVEVKITSLLVTSQ